MGFVRLDDLNDPTPLFGLRFSEAHRGKGPAAPILTALMVHVFSALPEVDRFELFGQ